METQEEMSRYFWSASTNCLPVVSSYIAASYSGALMALMLRWLYRRKTHKEVRKDELQTDSQPRKPGSFTSARRCSKDSGSLWSRELLKTLKVDRVGFRHIGQGADH
jgi:hypothetical protein